MKLLWIAVALLLAGCATPASEPTDDKGRFDAATAAGIYKEHRSDIGLHEVLGLVAHKGTQPLPWAIGTSPFGTSEGDLENGRASTWNMVLYHRAEQELQWYLITAEGIEKKEGHPASALGWNLEYNDAEGYGAGWSDNRAAYHGGHTCQFAGRFDGMGNSTQFDGDVISYVARIWTHGDDCVRSKPMGFTGVEDHTWIVDGKWYDNQGTEIDPQMPVSLLNEAVAVDGTLPGLPVAPVSHMFQFEAGEGRMEVHARLISGPEFYNDGTITLTDPDGGEWSIVGDLAELDLEEGDVKAGTWTLTMSWDTSQPGATFNVAAQVVQI